MIYVVPALNAVNFDLTVYVAPSLTKHESGLSVYSVPSLSSVDFSLVAYTVPTSQVLGGAVDFELLAQTFSASGFVNTSTFGTAVLSQSAVTELFANGFENTNSFGTGSISVAAIPTAPPIINMGGTWFKRKPPVKHQTKRLAPASLLNTQKFGDCTAKKSKTIYLQSCNNVSIFGKPSAVDSVERDEEDLLILMLAA